MQPRVDYRTQDTIDALWANVPTTWLEAIVNDPHADFYDPDDAIQAIDDIAPEDDYDQDGIDNLVEYLKGTDPADFFNGEPATLRIYWGDGQTAAPGDYLDMSLYVQVFDADGAKWVNAPVKFTAADDYAGLTDFSESKDLHASLIRRTTIIAAQAEYRVPIATGSYTVTASLPDGQSVTFTLYSDDSPSVGGHGPRNFRFVNNDDGTTTYTWISDEAVEGDWFHIKHQRDDGSWEVVHKTTYGSAELPYVPGKNAYSLTIETIPESPSPKEPKDDE